VSTTTHTTGAALARAALAGNPSDGYGGRAGRYESLDTALLPPLLIAWRSATAGESYRGPRPLRDRHARRDPEVAQTMTDFASVAAQARDARVAREIDQFGRCVDRTFDLRRRLLTFDPRCAEMVDVARSCGAHANYTGSGGAIVAVCRGDQQLDEVADALTAAGCGAARA
jgi:glucuronokinase